MASCVSALVYNNMLSLACTLLSDHLRLHFISARPGETLLVTRDMGSASKAQHCQTTTNEVANASKSGSHKQQNSQIVVSSVCADSSSRHRVFHSEGSGSNRSIPAHESMRVQQWNPLNVCSGWVVDRAVPGFLNVSGFWQ
eukprot:4697319-Amphidinium_carterae.1